MTLAAEPLPDLPGAYLTRVPIAGLRSEHLPGEDRLSPSERSHAAAASPRRRREFVAGRAALRTSLLRAGLDVPFDLLPGERGQPDLPSGWTGSISHKDGLAVAVAAPARGATVGVDCETLDRDRSAIARKVLRPVELQRWRAAGSRWADLLQVFSVKEAIYKALHPHVPRYIDFTEAELAADGSISLHLARGEGPFQLRGRAWWEGQRLFSVVVAERR